MKALLVEPGKKPQEINIEGKLKSMQELVGGTIQAISPFPEKVAVICNDEGKLLKLPLNRSLFDEDSEMYDIIAGTFFVCGIGEESFTSLTEQQLSEFTERYNTPEIFINLNGEIAVLPMPTDVLEKNDEHQAEQSNSIELQ